MSESYACERIKRMSVTWLLPLSAEWHCRVARCRVFRPTYEALTSRPGAQNGFDQSARGSEGLRMAKRSSHSDGYSVTAQRPGAQNGEA
jgi:hypothetical protein